MSNEPKRPRRRTTHGGRRTPNDKRLRVAVLGAGPAGLAAAYGLTSSEDLRRKYEVSVYQVGWRAGGKVRSGRQGRENRITTTGTHYLFGDYYNALGMARECFEELNDAGVESFGSFDTEFRALSLAVFRDYFQGEPTDWILQMPTNFEAPGTPLRLSLASVLSMTLQWLVEFVAGWDCARRIAPHPPTRPSWSHTLTAPLKVGLQGVLKLVSDAASFDHDDRAIRMVTDGLRTVRRVAHTALGDEAKGELQVQRMLILVDLAITTMIGLIEDRVLAKGGMAAIDGYDYRDWLTHHGAWSTAVQSSLVRGWYDAIASYQNGTEPQVSAGCTINALLRAFIGYQGAFSYIPAREIGESWVAPIFEVLERRGVRFKFFHRVWDLEVKDGQIATITVEQQVRLKKKLQGRYRPFVTVQGKRAWPDKPLYDQIRESSKIDSDGHKLENVNLEDFYTPWRGRYKTLQQGKHFDLVVYALPVGTLPYYCSDILRDRADWRKMVKHVQGIDTAAPFFYLKPDLAGLGWPYPSAVVTAIRSPLRVWEDASILIESETWPAGEAPNTIASMCSPMAGPSHAPGPNDGGEYADQQKTQAFDMTLHFAEHDAGLLWPDAADPDDPDCINWQDLVDPANGSGSGRLSFQQINANYGPVDRYTLALPGALKHRLASDQSGYPNLFLAGDWTRNGSGIGTIEGAVVSGMRASIAISGEGSIVGDDPNSGL